MSLFFQAPPAEQLMEPGVVESGARWASAHPVLAAIALGVLCGLGVSLDAFESAGILVGLVVISLSFRYPGFILTALLGMMLFQRFQMIRFGMLGVPMSLAKLSAFMAIVVFVGQALIRRQRIFVMDHVTVGLLAIVFAFLVSTLAADDPMDSRRRMMSIVLLATLTYFSYRFVRREHVKFLINVLPLLMGLLCAVSLWDLTHGGVWSRATEIAADAEIIRGGGSFGDPNVWSSVNLFFMPLILLHFAQSKRWIVRAFDLAVLAGLVINVGLSFSRAGYLVLGMLVIAVLWQQRRKPWLAIALAALMVAVLLYAVPIEVIEQRFNRLMMFPSQSDKDSSLYTRYQVLVGGFEVFLENPLWGVGPAQYGQYVSYGGMADYGKSAHNIYMQVVVELGLLGAAAFSWLLYGVIGVWNRLRKARLDPFARDFFRFTNLSFFSYFLMGATLNILFHSYMWFMLGVALSAGRWAFDGTPVEEDPAQPVPQAPAPVPRTRLLRGSA